MSKPVAMSQKAATKKIIYVPRMVLGRGSRPRGVKVKDKPSASKEQDTAQLRAQVRSKFRGSRMKSARSCKSSMTGTREEAAAQLRQQVKEELSWRFRACSHRAYECTLPVLPSRDYCARHILQDSTASYRQCAHTYQSGRRCPLPAPLVPSLASSESGRRDMGLCFEHARASLASRQRSAALPPPVATTETLLNSLQHYVKPERPRTTSCASTVSVVSDPADDNGLPPTVDPFKQVDAAAVNNGVWSGLMDAFSDTDSDADSVTLGRGGSCRAGADEDLSGDEDTSYDRHPLRHAGVFTAEESVCESRTAMRLLQAAYLRQMTRLRTLLQSARAQYLRALRQERERNCSINAQSRSGQVSARERRQLRKLKAYAGYHRRHGTDAVLARKLHHKRAKASHGAAPPRAAQGRCSFTEGGVRCEAQSLPAAKHCLKHIMRDRQQVLFTECGDSRAGVVCREAVPRVSAHGLGCRYHTDVPNYTVFTLKKDESGSDSDTNTATDEGEAAQESPRAAI